jgi:acetate kinase
VIQQKEKWRLFLIYINTHSLRKNTLALVLIRINPGNAPAEQPPLTEWSMNEQPLPVLLVLNAGSSSVKFSLYNAIPHESFGPECLGSGSVQIDEAIEHLSFRAFDSVVAEKAQWPRGEVSSQGTSLVELMQWLERKTGARIRAAAHRVVHGGSRSTSAARVDAALIAELQALVPIAPLHQQACLAPIAYLNDEHPDIPQFVCFDTTFHQSLDRLETTFGLPRAMTERGLRRYGFHGLSYEYIASVLPDYDHGAAEGRTIIAHLGSGASLCAMHNCVSRATTMGMTPLDGLLMGTRPGRLDPGVLLYLMRELGMSVPALEHLLYHQCGLLGVSGGISSDMRELSGSEAPEAAEAIALFVRSVVREIGSLAAVMGGIDSLVFTGGIGENAVAVRQAIIDGCAWLGIEQDPSAAPQQTARLSLPGSRVSAWVIPTDENAVIARHVLALMPSNR